MLKILSDKKALPIRQLIMLFEFYEFGLSLLQKSLYHF